MQKVVISILLLLSVCISHAQDKEELQRKRQELKKEIEDAEKMLNETKKTAKVNVGQLHLLNKKIDIQGDIITNISGQLRYIEDDIYKSQLEINKLTRILDTLKQEYAKSMVYSYKNRNNYDFINFIFSASSFNDAIKRIAYLKSYRSYREMQGENILRTRELLHERIKELSGKKEQKNTILEQKNMELGTLEKQQQEKESVVQKLKSRQKELTAQMANKKRQDIKLKNMIEAMIRKEIEIARKKAEDERKLAAAAKKTEANVTKTTTTRVIKKNESVLVSSDADIALNENFERNKGSLPWPTDGFILNHYGTNEYPGGVKYNNPGVTIGAQVGANVKAIFDGEVTQVSYIEDKEVVFIKHGKYFTVYSNLSGASVQKGQQVKTGQLIGKAGMNDDGQGEVDLILMKEDNNVNPEQWLRRK
jgi:murein hydrolase activator